MKHRFLTIAALAFALAATPAMALDLHSGRANGSIGEKTDGYVQALASTPEAAALAAEVNAKRKGEYAKISASKGQPLDVVGKIAAQQIISTLPAGSSYQGANGSWQKK